MAGVPESTALLAGGVSVATRSSGYISQSGQTSIFGPPFRVVEKENRNSRGRMNYDAEKASAAAAFSEENVRRGFIKKVEQFRKGSFKYLIFLLVLSGLLHTFSSTPGHLWHCGTLQSKLWNSNPFHGQ